MPGLSFLAYGTNRFGVNMAAGDIDGDSFDEIITGAGPGAVFGPHVRAFNYDGVPPVTPISGVNFFAYAIHKWGVNVAAGDIDGDEVAEIVTGAGPGDVFGPHVRGWHVVGGMATPLSAVSYLAYGTNRYRVVVSCGDVDGDAIEEIVTAPGPYRNFGAHIRGWNYDGSAVSNLPGFDFLAWPLADGRFGANVSANADLDGNGRDDIIVAGGPDPAVEPRVWVFTYDGSVTSQRFSLQAFPSTFTHGVSVAGVDR